MKKKKRRAYQCTECEKRCLVFTEDYEPPKIVECDNMVGLVEWKEFIVSDYLCMATEVKGRKK